MRTTTSILIGAAAALLFAAQAPAATTPRSHVKIVGHGIDGNTRYYTAYCPDGRHTALEYRFKKHEVCYMDSGGKTRCLKNSSVDEAGKQACGTR
jgi:hypothetical protein